MPDSADLAILPFFNSADLRWFLMTEIRRLHVVGAVAALECLLPLFPLSPRALDSVVVFTLRIVRDGAFFLFLAFFRAVVFNRVNGLERGRKTLVLCFGGRGLGCCRHSYCGAKEKRQ